MTRQDATDIVSTTLAAAAVVIPALLAVVLVVAVAAIWSQGARRLLTEVRDSLLGGELWVAWGFALIATLGSLFFSEVSQFDQVDRQAWLHNDPGACADGVPRDHHAAVDGAVAAGHVDRI